jgi:urea transporter/murein DD-endopeptidase MepM/ murein hydrolase activator NlpD
MNVASLQKAVCSLLRSYAILFFSKDLRLGGLLLLVSFFNPHAGLSGLVAVLISLLLARAVRLDPESSSAGLYSFNALLLGLGMGALFELSAAFWLLLSASVLLTLMGSAILQSRLGRDGLPFLSIPFVLAFWLMVLASREYSAIGLCQRNIYWMNSLYDAGGMPLIRFYRAVEVLPIPELMRTYFRALSAIVFQSNLISGMLIAAGLLLFSRIFISLSILGFLSAFLFNHLIGADEAGINTYNLGCNFMLASAAVGGIFCIPSRGSYLAAICMVPLMSLMVIALESACGLLRLPLFSLPFSLLVIGAVYFFGVRLEAGGLHLTPFQYYHPETNLYSFLNETERLRQINYLKMRLPFIGEWVCSQGYDGTITHRGDWAKALDFIVLDSEMKPHQGRGIACENYYCYNKPVLAAADGVVEEIVDSVEDNLIGQVNVAENWGNVIVIRHSVGLYSQLCHLRKGSFIVKKGDVVKAGDILAACGNSGRSPAPHLHFQIQATPQIGSPTLSYPIAHFYARKSGMVSLQNYSQPEQGMMVSDVAVVPAIAEAFSFPLGARLKVKGQLDGQPVSEQWESKVDVYNRTYLYSKETGGCAYFQQNGTLFYFTAFYGPRKSLLHLFHLSSYKVLLAFAPQIEVADAFPLTTVGNRLLLWLQDFIAPFHIFLRSCFAFQGLHQDDPLFPSDFLFRSRGTLHYFRRSKCFLESRLTVRDRKLFHWEGRAWRHSFALDFTQE